MEKYIVLENQEKLKKTGTPMLIGGIAMIIAGFILYITITVRDGIGALSSAVMGGFIGGAYPMITTGSKRKKLLKSEPRTVFAADEKGIYVSKDPFTEAEIFIPWVQISVTQLIGKAKDVFAVMLKNPEEYISSITDKQYKRFAKSCMRFHKTPIIVTTGTASIPANEIVVRLNEMPKTVV